MRASKMQLNISHAWFLTDRLYYGNRPAFELVSLVAVLSYAVQGLATSGLLLGAVGGGSMAANVVYGLAFSLVQMTGGVCSFKPCMVRAFVSD